MDLYSLLGKDADDLLGHRCKGITADEVIAPGPSAIDEVMTWSDRPIQVLRSLARCIRTAGWAAPATFRSCPSTRASSIRRRPASPATRPTSTRRTSSSWPSRAGCNAVATTFGVLGIVARRYAHKIPFIVKLNHNELLTYPNQYDQIMFGSAREAYELGAVGVGATIYFGSEHATRQIQEVSEAFQEAHELGMFTVLWCYLRNNAFKKDGVDYSLSADLTGQANHLGVTIEADIIKQKQAENNGGYNAIGFGRTDPLVYDQLTTDNPIDLTRWQVVNCYMGRIPLINSGGESTGDADLAQAVRTAVINKRAGGAGLITGRKAFQRPTREGSSSSTPSRTSTWTRRDRPGLNAAAARTGHRLGRLPPGSLSAAGSPPVESDGLHLRRRKPS